MEAIRLAVAHNPNEQFIPSAVAICCYFSARFFQISDELSNLAWHVTILLAMKLVS
jgi:hypothetical protein